MDAFRGAKGEHPSLGGTLRVDENMKQGEINYREGGTGTLRDGEVPVEIIYAVMVWGGMKKPRGVAGWKKLAPPAAPHR